MSSDFPVIFSRFIPAAFAVLSFALLLWQFLAARRFPLHKRIANPAFSPAVTILKPLKGCDPTTTASLESWLRLDYAGPAQFLFGVADAADPVCGVVRDLLGKYPNADAQLIVCAEALGMNAKVSTLMQLERAAKYDLILASDADVRVPEDFLASIAAPLSDPDIALVNCFYRLANPVTLPMQWEAVAINADFWSQVLQSRTLKPLDFALGAAILQRRRSLEQAGGFAAFANCLADDYQIGNRIARNGGKIALCPVVVECWEAPMNWPGVWKHQLRWARTIRVCQPVPYFFSILSNGSLWPLIWLVESLWLSKAICAMAATVLLCARMVIAGNLQRQLNEGREPPAPFWLAPVKDLLQTAIWAIAFCGNRVEWRGRKLRLRRDGNLEPILS